MCFCFLGRIPTALTSISCCSSEIGCGSWAKCFLVQICGPISFSCNIHFKLAWLIRGIFIWMVEILPYKLYVILIFNWYIFQQIYYCLSGFFQKIIRQFLNNNYLGEIIFIFFLNFYRGVQFIHVQLQM